MGQSAATSSVFVRATVHDASGAVIRGASVEVVNNAGATVSHATSDAHGAFHVSLPPGEYSLNVSAAGFSPISIAIDARAAHSVDVTLPIETVKESVNVEDSPMAPKLSSDVAANQSANELDSNALQRLPVFEQDYVTMFSRFLSDVLTGTNGVSLVVNGVESNGPGVAPSAIRSVKINNNPYSAMFSSPGRARLEIVTAEGTPQLHGTLVALFRDSIFDATPVFAATKPKEQRRYYEGAFTGPIPAMHKTTFLTSFHLTQLDQQANVVAQSPSGEINENVPTPHRHGFVQARVFHTYGDANTLWVGYSYEHASQKDQGVGGVVLPSAGVDDVNYEHEINVGDTHIVSPHLVNNLRFLIGHNADVMLDVSDGPRYEVTDTIVFGSAQGDFRRTENHVDGNDTVTYSTGKHVWNFGIDVPDISRRGFTDERNNAGTYYYQDLSQLAADRPFEVQVQRGRGHTTFWEKVVAGFVEDSYRVSPKLSLNAGLRYYFQNYFHDRATDLAPRLGFAYSPARDGKTIIRGGAGIFYDRTGPKPISYLRLYNGYNIRTYLLEDPTLPITDASLAAVPVSVWQLDPRQRIPYTFHYSGGVERQLSAKSTLGINYVGFRGIDLFRSVDLNAPLVTGAARPDSAVGQLRDVQSDGYQKNNAIEVTFRGILANRFTGQAKYTLSKTYNNTSGITWFPENSYDAAADWGRSDFDRRHKLDLMEVVQLPKAFNLGLTFSAYSGLPENIVTGADDNGDGVVNDRPAGMPRNTMHGPGTCTIDLSVARDFNLSKKETRTLTIALNAFNALNERNDIAYVSSVSSPFFGQAILAQPPRRMQMKATFRF